MDMLNPIGLILGIISSAMSIYVFIQKRMHARPAVAAHTAAPRTAAPQSAAAPMPTEAAPPGAVS